MQKILWLIAMMCWPSLVVASSVRLSWMYSQEPQNPAVGFIIERCTGVDCTDFVAITPSPLPLTPTLFTDTSVQAATSYRWRVRAINAQGETSEPSNSVSFRIPLPPINVPSGLQGMIVP